MRIHLASVYVDERRPRRRRHPLAQFAVDDVQGEYERLTQRVVVFTQPPTDLGNVVIAVFDDTCGNLIQIAAEGPS